MVLLAFLDDQRQDRSPCRGDREQRAYRARHCGLLLIGRADRVRIDRKRHFRRRMPQPLRDQRYRDAVLDPPTPAEMPKRMEMDMLALVLRVKPDGTQ